jgi:4-hydroxybutyrate dehydrogenase/sulfolactaldehyde 3-reductase
MKLAFIGLGTMGAPMARRLMLGEHQVAVHDIRETAEALNLAVCLGLDQAQTAAMLRQTPAGQGQINTNFPKKVLNGDISPDFPLRMGFKDISLGLALARSVGAASPLGTVARTLFEKAGPLGRAEQDCTAMLYLIARSFDNFDVLQRQSNSRLRQIETD